MERYFYNKIEDFVRIIGSSQKDLNQCLTETYQVGTEMVEIDGQQIEQPKLELVWKEITKEEYDSLQPKEPVIEYKPTYEQLVNQYVREKYPLDEELAVLRQRDSNPAKFEAYFNYCEDCKKRARNEVQNGTL